MNCIILYLLTVAKGTHFSARVTHLLVTSLTVVIEYLLFPFLQLDKLDNKLAIIF